LEASVLFPLPPLRLITAMVAILSYPSQHALQAPGCEVWRINAAPSIAAALRVDSSGSSPLSAQQPVERGV
jgi:hypothetical protein